MRSSLTSIHILECYFEWLAIKCERERVSANLCCYQKHVALFLWTFRSLIYALIALQGEKAWKRLQNQGESRQRDKIEPHWIFPTSPLKRSCAVMEKHSISIMRAPEDNFCTRENRKMLPPSCISISFLSSHTSVFIWRLFQSDANESGGGY